MQKSIREFRNFGIFPVILMLTCIGLTTAGFLPGPAVAAEMEATLTGPQSNQETTQTEVSPAEESVSAAPDPESTSGTQRSWLGRLWNSVASFFKLLFTGETKTHKGGSVTSTVGLNIRTGPGTGNKSIGVLSYGEEVNIIGSRPGWYKIQLQDGTGWVSKRYVSVEGEAPKKPIIKLPEKPLPPPVDYGYVNATGLNVRSGPGVENNRLHVLKNLDSVQILGQKNGWYRIKAGGTVGWVSGKYITLGKAPEIKTPPKPEKVYVEVPKRTQYDPANGKYQGSWCGPTSLAMVYEYYGRKETTESVARRVYDFKNRTGTDANKIVADAKAHGFPNTTIKTGVDFDYLKENISQGRPVIVGVEVAWKYGHYMVVVGIEGDNIIVNDPGRRDVRRTFSKTWFLRQWEGRWRRSIVLK